jgi:farnesyl diphosphate synthase
MGAASGPCSPAQYQALSDYGAALGLAFQVVDDILDVTQSSATLGKSAGKDLDANKPTYVTVLGLDEARRQAHALHQQALAALAQGGLAGAEHLRLLADMVVDRHS